MVNSSNSCSKCLLTQICHGRIWIGVHTFSAKESSWFIRMYNVQSWLKVKLYTKRAIFKVFVWPKTKLSRLALSAVCFAVYCIPDDGAWTKIGFTSRLHWWWYLSFSSSRAAAWLPRKLTGRANTPLNKSCSTRYWIEKYPSRRSWSGRLLNNRWPIKPIRVVTAIILDLLLTVWSRVVQIQALYRLNCQRWSQVGGQAWGYAWINP